MRGARVLALASCVALIGVGPARADEVYDDEPYEDESYEDEPYEDEPASEEAEPAEVEPEETEPRGIFGLPSDWDFGRVSRVPLDVFVVRPLTLSFVPVGFMTYALVAAPASLIEGGDSPRANWDQLVVGPARWTFTTPLADWDW